MTLLEDLGIEKNVSRIIGASDYKKSQKVYIFTGKGPRSKNYHLGNLLCHLIVSKASLKMNCPVLFQISNDEKSFEANNSLEQAKELATMVKSKIENIFWPNNIILFENLNPLNYLLLKMYGDKIAFQIKINKISSVFGNVSLFNGMYSMMQLAPIVHFNKFNFKDYRPIIITESGEVGYFLLFRDFCRKLKIKEPIIIEIEPLKDIFLKDKMSSNNPMHCVDFSEEGLKKILKSISDPSGEKDFCIHLINFFIPFLENPIKQNLESIVQNYKNSKNSLIFKNEVITQFSSLLKIKNTLNFYYFLNKDIDIFSQLSNLDL